MEVKGYPDIRPWEFIFSAVKFIPIIVFFGFSFELKFAAIFGGINYQGRIILKAPGRSRDYEIFSFFLRRYLSQIGLLKWLFVNSIITVILISRICVRISYYAHHMHHAIWRINHMYAILIPSSWKRETNANSY
jgi:hypothetical protein